VFVLTARADCVASAIAEFLTAQGVTVNEVHCVGSATGGDIAKAKRTVLLSIIENFTKVWFYDDDARNIALANDLDCTAIKQ
jgi:maleate cis-trans isomerase